MIDDYDVYEDIKDKLYNLYNDEACVILSKILCKDKNLGFFDYKSFLLNKMNARALMEIRNSYLVPWKDDNDRKNIPVIDDYVAIRKYREDKLKKIVKGYQGFQWQLYFLIVFGFKGRKYEDFEVNFDGLFEDSHSSFDWLLGEQYYMDCFSVTKSNDEGFTKYMESGYSKQGLKFRIR